VALTAGATVWLASDAGHTSVRAVAGLGAGAVVVLALTLVVRRPEGIALALLLVGTAYAVTLVVDDPPLDGRAAILGAALLATGELAHLSLGARTRVAQEAGAPARRVALVAVLAIAAMALGGAVLALTDRLRTGGIGIEVVGVAAALAAVGLLVRAAHEARST
jgi:hypothetical protein